MQKNTWVLLISLWILHEIPNLQRGRSLADTVYKAVRWESHRLIHTWNIPVHGGVWSGKKPYPTSPIHQEKITALGHCSVCSPVSFTSKQQIQKRWWMQWNRVGTINKLYYKIGKIGWFLSFYVFLWQQAVTLENGNTLVCLCLKAKHINTLQLRQFVH